MHGSDANNANLLLDSVDAIEAGLSKLNVPGKTIQVYTMANDVADILSIDTLTFINSAQLAIICLTIIGM